MNNIKAGFVAACFGGFLALNYNITQWQWWVILVPAIIIYVILDMGSDNQ